MNDQEKQELACWLAERLEPWLAERLEPWLAERLEPRVCKPDPMRLWVFDETNFDILPAPLDGNFAAAVMQWFQEKGKWQSRVELDHDRFRAAFWQGDYGPAMPKKRWSFDYAEAVCLAAKAALEGGAE